ncbi:MAG: hypothetical protein PF961_07385 [Planctomycetota bacterium]|jgi:hypothetical protein|nr:hypothetical protein [Planctomycetota bacterium]
MKTTPQMLAAGGVTLLCLAATVGVLLGGIPGFDVTKTDLTLAVDKTAVTDSAAALDPVVPRFGADRVRNPFNLKPEARRLGVDIPMPPPPALHLPAPPALPGEGR